MNERDREIIIDAQVTQLEEDLKKNISFDEWSAIEYGQTEIDYYDSACNLHKLGYRKQEDVVKDILISLKKLNDCYIVDKQSQFTLTGFIQKQLKQYGVELW